MRVYQEQCELTAWLFDGTTGVSGKVIHRTSLEFTCLYSSTRSISRVVSLLDDEVRISSFDSRSRRGADCLVRSSSSTITLRGIVCSVSFASIRRSGGRIDWNEHSLSRETRSHRERTGERTMMTMEIFFFDFFFFFSFLSF